MLVWYPNPPQLSKQGSEDHANSLQASEAKIAGHAASAELDYLYRPLHEDADSGGGIGRSGAALWSTVRAVAADACGCLSSPSFVLTALSGGATMAVWGAWSGVLPTVMVPEFTAGQVGSWGGVGA